MIWAAHVNQAGEIAAKRLCKPSMIDQEKLFIHGTQSAALEDLRWQGCFKQSRRPSFNAMSTILRSTPRQLAKVAFKRQTAVIASIFSLIVHKECCAIAALVRTCEWFIVQVYSFCPSRRIPLWLVHMIFWWDGTADSSLRCGGSKLFCIMHKDKMLAML
jgi:hypothetical protein